MKLTKTIQTFKNGEYHQEIDITADATHEGLEEVLSVEARNFKNGKEISMVPIMEFLTQMNALDSIIDQFNWSLEYAEHVSGEKEYNELNRN